MPQTYCKDRGIEVNLLLIVRSRAEDVYRWCLISLIPLNLVFGVVWGGENPSVRQLVSSDGTTTCVIARISNERIVCWIQDKNGTIISNWREEDLPVTQELRLTVS